MKKKPASVLRLEYQRVLGRPIGDRAWRKVKGYLRIKEEDISHIEVVRALAHLRRLNPYKTIRRRDAEIYSFVSQNLPQFVCTGMELRAALKRMQPPPSDVTIYRWGHQIKCPFSVHRVYSPNEVAKWVVKVVSQTNFRYQCKD